MGLLSLLVVWTARCAAASVAAVKTIGMLGGMSWESTALYYRLADEGVRERAGGLASASLLVRSLDVAQVRELQVEDRWDDAEALLLAEGKALVAAGADLVVLCTDDMHEAAGPLETGLGVPFLHLADVAAAPGPVVGLLGAGGTMREPFHADRLRAHGLTVLTPDEAGMDRVDRAVFDELCRGVLSDTTRADLTAIVAALAERGADAVALCCTELELLLRQEDCPVPLLPSAALHVRAALAAAA